MSKLRNVYIDEHGEIIENTRLREKLDDDLFRVADLLYTIQSERDKQNKQTVPEPEMDYFDKYNRRYDEHNIPTGFNTVNRYYYNKYGKELTKVQSQRLGHLVTNYCKRNGIKKLRLRKGTGLYPMDAINFVIKCYHVEDTQDTESVVG